MTSIHVDTKCVHTLFSWSYWMKHIFRQWRDINCIRPLNNVFVFKQYVKIAKNNFMTCFITSYNNNNRRTEKFYTVQSSIVVITVLVITIRLINTYKIIYPAMFQLKYKMFTMIFLAYLKTDRVYANGYYFNFNSNLYGLEIKNCFKIIFWRFV